MRRRLCTDDTPDECRSTLHKFGSWYASRNCRVRNEKPFSQHVRTIPIFRCSHGQDRYKPHFDVGHIPECGFNCHADFREFPAPSSGRFVLLGTAWNFLYLGGTALVFNSIDENQAHAGQRANEISVDVGNLIASASVGFLIYQVGMISVFIFSTVLCVFIAIMIFRKMEM